MNNKSKSFVILFIIFVCSCNSLKNRNKEANHYNNDPYNAEQIFKEKWIPRKIKNNIVGHYTARTPPLSCNIDITKDSLVYLERTSLRYDIFLYDTLKIAALSLNKPLKFKLSSICVKPSDQIFDTAYYDNGFLLFKDNRNYLLFYKTSDEKGNYIALPEFKDWMELYFGYLHASGIEKKIIDYYFDPNFSKLPKLEYKF